jgi:hypothetical protein
MAPSMLCQRHAMPSIWSYSASPAFQIAWNTPAFSQSRNRLWTALALPNRSLGKAFHWQPVRSTYTTASNTCRAGLGGRPAPGFRTYSLSAGRSRTGISGSTLCQKSSVTTHESTRFLVAKVLPYTASPAAQGCSLLFTVKFLVAPTLCRKYCLCHSPKVGLVLPLFGFQLLCQACPVRFLAKKVVSDRVFVWLQGCLPLGRAGVEQEI